MKGLKKSKEGNALNAAKALIKEWKVVIDRCHSIMREEPSAGTVRYRACNGHVKQLKENIAQLERTKQMLEDKGE